MASRALAAACVLLLFGGAACLDAPAPGASEAPTGRAVIASSQRLASEAGAETLRSGGNAIDAAASVQWALNVVEPSMSGLGGGSLLLLWLNESKEFVFLDGREMAPAASTPDQFLLPNGDPQPFEVAHTRGYAVGVPGTLRVFSMAVERYGNLPFARSFDAGIELARDGFAVGGDLASYIPASETKLRSWPATAEIFFRDAVCPPAGVPPMVSGQAGCVGGTALAEGDRFVNEDLAKTFTILQAQGPDAFYDGPIGAALVDAQAARQGRMVAQDLVDYVAKERAPVEATYGDARIVSAPPPSAGGLTMLEILGILEPVGLEAKGFGSVDALHWMTEAMHLAYQDRYAYIGDSDYEDVPFEGLLSPAFHAERRALIDPERADPDPRAGDPWKHESRSGPTPDQELRGSDQGMHTTHFVVVDGHGNVAAVTTTLENLFGTGITVPGYGFLLNNQLTDFDFIPGGPNEVEPGKRPRSSMTPTIVERGGQPFLAVGSPGGPTITTTVMQVVLNVLEHGMGLGESVTSPRIFSSDYPRLSYEDGFAAGVVEELRRRGHEPVGPGRIGHTPTVMVEDGVWVGQADPRGRDGAVAYVLPDEVVPLTRR